MDKGIQNCLYGHLIALSPLTISRHADQKLPFRLRPRILTAGYDFSH